MPVRVSFGGGFGSRLSARLAGESTITELSRRAGKIREPRRRVVTLTLDVTDPMPQLSSSDCEKLLALTGELYTIEDVGSLPQSILRSLQTIIPHEFGGCHLIEPSRRQKSLCCAGSGGRSGA